MANQAFGDAPGSWTVQRKDVDNFFGSTVEADFTVLEEATTGTRLEHLTDPRKRRLLRSTILLDGRPVDHFVPRGPVPDKFTLVGVEEAGMRTPIVIKMSEQELAEAAGGNWQIELNCDVRYPAFVSLIKAAFLTKFALFGYRYALSPAGLSVGAHLLGRFFIECRGLSRAEISAKVPPFFGHLENMVRPMLSNPGYKGTTVESSAPLLG